LIYRVSLPGLSTGVALIAMLVLGPLISLAIALEAWKLLALLLLIAGVPVLLHWPVVVAFGLYALVIPFDLVAALSSAGGATVSKLVGVVAMAVLIAVGLIERRLVRPPATTLYVGLFILWGLLSTGWSVSPEVSASRIQTSVSLLLFYVVAASFRVTTKEFRAVIVLTIVGGVLAASVVMILGGDLLTKSGRAMLTLEEQSANINHFAAGLIVPLLLAIGRLFDTGRFLMKAFAFGAQAIIVSCIYVLASRGTALAAIVGLALMTVRSRRVWRALLVAVVCLVLVVLTSDVFVTRINALLEGTDTTGTGRTRIWMVAYRALDQYWMFGSGISTFQTVYSMYASVAPTKNAPASHSIYVSTLVELGLPGLMLLLFGLTMHFRASSKFRRPSIYLVSVEASCLASMVAAAFGDFLTAKTFWLPWTLLIWSMRLHAAQGRRVEARSVDAVPSAELGVVSSDPRLGATPR
jgi:O-antigen ligase